MWLESAADDRRGRGALLPCLGGFGVDLFNARWIDTLQAKGKEDIAKLSVSPLVRVLGSPQVFFAEESKISAAA